VKLQSDNIGLVKLMYLAWQMLLSQNFWGLLKKFMHKSTRSQISELKQISTDVGRCRVGIPAICDH